MPLSRSWRCTRHLRLRPTTRWISKSPAYCAMPMNAAWEQFHLVGYSGGGAAALAFAARHSERLASLALLEPAWAGRRDLSPHEQALWREYDRLEALPPDEFTRAFMRLNVKPGVELPPPPTGDPPPWMAKRPGGIRAFMKTFKTYELDHDALARFDQPVYYALGGLSNPDQFGADRNQAQPCLPELRARDIRRATPLRPAASDRARAARELTESTLASQRSPVSHTGKTTSARVPPSLRQSQPSLQLVSHQGLHDRETCSRGIGFDSRAVVRYRQHHLTVALGELDLNALAAVFEGVLQ